MSGIEIIGVVLGALPLLISAYKQRRHVKGAASALTQFETKYDEFLDDVEQVQLLLQLSIRRVLAPLVDAAIVSEEQVDEYIHDPDPSSEVSNAVARALQNNRDKSNERCFKLMGEIHEAILTLLEEVDFYDADVQAYLSREQNARLLSKASMSYFRSALHYRNAQLRFSVKTKTRETVLDKIRAKQKQISELAVFSNTSMRVGTPQLRMAMGHGIQFLLAYARHVACIYRLTQGRWGCQCMDQHFACIWLKHPAPRTSNFDFLVVPNRDAGATRPWKPQGLTVRWNANSSVHEIDVLCNVLSALSSPKLGTLTDRSESGQYSVHSLPTQVAPLGSVTLLEVLRKDHPQRLWKNRTSRFQLALAIASAHLQLLSATWVSAHWSIKDILFPRSSDVRTDAELEMPFVEGDFKDPPSVSHRRPDRAFTSLGIMLMELLFGEFLDDHSMWQQDGWLERKSDVFMRMLVAKQWVDDVLSEGAHCIQEQ